MYSIEDGKENRIRTTVFLTEAIQYAICDENATEIFEFDENDELLGCVWTKDSAVRCVACGNRMNMNGCNSDDNYMESEYVCTKCGTVASFKMDIQEGDHDNGN